MYLQSLELIGFKSFATKTTLEFHRGVTAVVGPNGCGKSNVLDAIRWVLGEQSAKALRGGEMADVIFSGTDSRQALGMAEVSMTFADCEKELGVDWNQVRITRRVFRDGKGEYLINKTPCRLRDIHELFMDTGIGRTAYSIMEQGKIDLILSSKPEDRRAIFEEAAGITKYKAQKKEALRKLEYTEANLVRVADIIREVKRQIGSLQRQAGKARRYQALSEALRVFDTHLTHRGHTALEAEIQQVRDQLAQIGETRNLHEAEMAEQEEELAGFRSRLAMMDEQASELRDQAQQARGRMLAAESRIESHGHRIEEFGNLIGRHETDIAAAREKSREQEQQIERTDVLIEELLAVLRCGEEELRAGEAKLSGLREERIATERGLAGLAAETSRIEGEISQVRTDQNATAARREAAESRLQTLRQEAAAAQAAAVETSGRIDEVAARIQSAEAAVRAAREAIESKTADLATLRAERSAAEENRRNAERQLEGLRAKLEVLRTLDATGEGLGEGAQALLRGLDNPEFFQPAMAGAVASLLEVEPKFVPAVEAVLGAALQVVLFKDHGVAESALQTLAAGEYGRGTLLPREWMPAPSPCGGGDLPHGAIAWLADCVRHPQQLGSFLGPKLCDIAVVEDLQTALGLRSLYPGLGFVTLGGEWISNQGPAAAGSMTPGAGAALLRKSEIAALEAEMGRALAVAADSDRHCADLAARTEEIERELADARTGFQSLQVECSTAKGEAQLLERQAAEHKTRAENFAREIAATEAGLTEAGNRLEEFESALARLRANLEQARGARADKESALATLRDREAEAGEELNALRLRVATERQQRENLERQREPMTARLHELADLVRQRERDIEDYRARIEMLNGETEELHAGIADSRTALDRAEADLAALIAQRAEIHESAEALETTLRVARKQLADLTEQRGRLEVRTTQIELRQQNLREHIARRYQLDLTCFEPDLYALRKVLKDQKVPLPGDAQTQPATAADAILPDEPATAEPAPDPGIPWTEIESIVTSLTERIDSMGPVNLDAIQEFEELEQRYTFLEQQNSDLTNSKAELLEVIARINKTTREMFAQTFEQVRINFQEMFGELFGGGRANLILADESDPLESGIDIIAKPPGKQLQSISLLSGGERTMTAVSLLFAIYMVKPSPFCVLDEMDAPLDESNISRFIKILDRFIAQSQFVVITHNKRTISRADMLYGVTMEEHGVSKLVGVKFHAREEEHLADAESAPAGPAEQELAGPKTGVPHLLEGELPIEEEATTPG